MKMIILAAGEGIRLRPYTSDKPKCMVPFNGKPIIDYIIDAAKHAHINDIVVLDGYKKDVLEKHLKDEKISFAANDDYARTNMVHTLFCAEKEMKEDIIISYADIIYNGDVLLKLKNSDAEVATVIDRNWLELWSMRMENPLRDAETLKLDFQRNIIELGKKTQSYDDIQGQYMGLIKISSTAVSKIINFYHGLDKKNLYDGKDYNNMYMTTFLQLIIDRLMPVKAVPVSGGWLEIDSIEDLDIYSRNLDSKIIRNIFQ